MGQKVNPHGLRVGVIKDWDSRWYASDEKVGAHRSVASSLKFSRQRAGFLLLVKTMLKLPSLL